MLQWCQLLKNNFCSTGVNVLLLFLMGFVGLYLCVMTKRSILHSSVILGRFSNYSHLIVENIFYSQNLKRNGVKSEIPSFSALLVRNEP